MEQHSMLNAETQQEMRVLYSIHLQHPCDSPPPANVASVTKTKAFQQEEVYQMQILKERCRSRF